jgi:hypothetical protein
MLALDEREWDFLWKPVTGQASLERSKEPVEVASWEDGVLGLAGLGPADWQRNFAGLPEAGKSGGNGPLLAAADTVTESGTPAGEAVVPVTSGQNSGEATLPPSGGGGQPAITPILLESGSESSEEPVLSGTNAANSNETGLQVSGSAVSPTVPENGLAGGYNSFGTPASFLNVPDPGSIKPSTIGSASSEALDRMLLGETGLSGTPLSNFRIGAMNFTLGASLSAEFDDNILGTTHDREADLILNPQATIQGVMKLTQYNSINLTLGFGYVWYVDHPNLDTKSPVVSPGTNFSFNVKVGPVLFNIYDQPAVAETQANQLTQRNSVGYSVFTNTAGLTALWDLNRITLTAGYDHVDTIALQSESDSQSGSEDQASFSAAVKYSSAISAGINGLASSIRYSNSIQNNGTTYSTGPFLDVRLTHHITVHLDGGYQVGSFGSGGTTEDTSSLGTYYADLSIAHDLNAYFQYSLSLGHNAQLGTLSNFVETNSISANATWKISSRTTLAADASVDDAGESGGIYAQHFQYYTFGLSTGWTLSRMISMNVYYRFYLREAGDPPAVEGASSLSYYENQVGVGFQVTF